VFSFEESDPNGGISVFAFNNTSPGNQPMFETAGVTGTFQSELAPEPGTTALTLIGLAWLLRKRIAHSFR
jgi:hypothetical protein